MSDISKFKVGNDTYNIKDEEAHSSITALSGRVTAAETAIADKVDNSKIGANDGVASLDSTGKVPSAQLPSYVDDVLEYTSLSAFPTTGESGKIYIAVNTNKSYRWTGTQYTEISKSLALGETSSTAYAGNKGKANAKAISDMKNGSSIDSFGDVETALGNKVDKVEGKGLSTNDYSDTEKGKVADNAEAIEAAWDGINRIMLQGRNLTVVFADEIADYSDEWAWIQARLNAHNVSGLRVGDYIPIKVGAENHLAEIAGINTYRRTGDTGHEVGYHIDWITRDCYSQTVQFNTTNNNNNNGNANSPSPFLASNLKSWLDGTLYPLLDAKLKNVIKAKRILAPSRYQSGATLTDDNSWAWQDFDKLWVPLETEIFDCLVWSTNGFGNGQAVQYPIFANSYEHRMKGVGPGGARASWWTTSAYSGNSTHVVHVNAYGTSYNDYASYAICVPVCFRTMEA